MRALGFAVVIGLAFAAPGRAGEVFDSCASLGASTYEAGYEGVGPADTPDYSPYDAADACTLAHDADPADVAVAAWLGRALLERNATAEGIRLLTGAADGGSIVAAAVLGDALMLGRGVPRDRLRGIDLIRRAAAAGFPPA